MDRIPRWVDRQRAEKRLRDEYAGGRNFDIARHSGNYNLEESWKTSRDETEDDPNLAYHQHLYADSRREAVQERERVDMRLSLKYADQTREDLRNMTREQEKKDNRAIWDRVLWWREEKDRRGEKNRREKK